MDRIGSWWDAIELWVAGLPFGPQFVVMIVVIVPISFAIARVLDRLLIAVLRLVGRGSAEEPVRSDGRR